MPGRSAGGGFVSPLPQEARRRPAPAMALPLYLVARFVAKDAAAANLILGDWALDDDEYTRAHVEREA